jgi:hypothetical protein
LREVTLTDPGRVLAKPVWMHRAIVLFTLPDKRGTAAHALQAELPECLDGRSFTSAVFIERAGFACGIDQIAAAVLDL